LLSRRQTTIRDRRPGEPHRVRRRRSSSCTYQESRQQEHFIDCCSTPWTNDYVCCRGRRQPKIHVGCLRGPLASGCSTSPDSDSHVGWIIEPPTRWSRTQVMTRTSPYETRRGPTLYTTPSATLHGRSATPLDRHRAACSARRRRPRAQLGPRAVRGLRRSCTALYEAEPPAVGPTGTTGRAQGRGSYASTYAHLGTPSRGALWEPRAASGPEDLRDSERTYASTHAYLGTAGRWTRKGTVGCKRAGRAACARGGHADVDVTQRPFAFNPYSRPR
jgi:hypothetical protein